MRKLKITGALLLLGFMLSVPQILPAQFITIARKIKSMKTDNKNVATVIIEAKASAVYRAMLDTLSSDKRFKIIRSDSLKRYVEFAKETNTFSMQADSLDNRQCQIMVLAVKSGENTSKNPTDPAVGAILAVCRKLGIEAHQ